jgi:hypothetical protein
MRWDRTIRDCALETVLGALYAHEINCGLQSFWDGGWSVWIGDDMNGVRAEADFQRDQLTDIPAWLADNAERLYPALRNAA